MAVIQLHASKADRPTPRTEAAGNAPVPDGLRHAMRQLVSGVSVIATGFAPKRAG